MTAKTSAELRREFDEFDRNNPRIWKLFERFTFDAIARGRKHYGGDAIFQRLRWHVDIETSEPEPNPDDPERSLKLNNNHRAFYVRKFIDEHPEHSDFFRVRASKADGEYQRPLL